jgi:arylsulfatase A-like enzyme
VSRRVTVRLLLLATVVAACARDGVPGGVVLIGIDTLRADRLSCYGYPRPTSPRIDAFAAESVLFEQAISQSSWTLPGFASIMTGLVPSRHGAGEGKRCLLAPCGSLEPDVPVLAEGFLRAGYRTASFVSNGYVGPGVGLGRGFEVADVEKRGETAVGKAIAWLTERRAEPFFLFVHVIEPHGPYAPPEEDRRLFVDPGYAGPVVAEKLGFADPAWSDADRSHVMDLYDADVHFTDRIVGRLFDALADLGLDDRTLVVLTSDHGEELFERGQLGHGQSVYDELLRVPLIVRFPGRALRGRVARQVRTMDVFPTMLEAMGRPVPPGLDAVSLLALAHGGPGDAALDTAVAEFTYVDPERKAVRQPPAKLIVDDARGTAAFFDLATDPGERSDRVGDHPDRVTAMRRLLPPPMARAAAGFYLLANGGRERKRLRIAMTVPAGTLTGSAIERADAGDVVTIAPGGGGATVELVLTPADVDEVRIEMSPVVLNLRLESATLDDAAIDGRRILLGAAAAAKPGGLALPATIAASAVAVPSPHVPPPSLDGQPVLGVQAVLVGKRPRLQFDETTRRHLEALGYAQ